jgi:hypothetical protein
VIHVDPVSESRGVDSRTLQDLLPPVVAAARAWEAARMPFEQHTD